MYVKRLVLTIEVIETTTLTIIQEGATNVDARQTNPPGAAGSDFVGGPGVWFYHVCVTHREPANPGPAERDSE